MKKNNLLVSVIITTRNEEENLETCLRSVKDQTYKDIEIIVVDNNSIDKTKVIANKYTKKVFNKGPERSVQRNFAVEKSKGDFVLILDADMKLSKDVVSDCVDTIKNEKVGGIIIPEESYGIGFWVQCKKLERSFYVGNDMIEAARFFSKKIFVEIGGFDEDITGPEDWDLSQRVKERFGLSRIQNKILHNEGNLSLIHTMKKKHYYSQKFKAYIKKKENKKYVTKQLSIIDRYTLFLSNPKILLRNPILSIGMLFMKTCEFIAGGIGYIFSLKSLDK